MEFYRIVWKSKSIFYNKFNITNFTVKGVVNHNLYQNILHVFTKGQLFCTVADYRGLVADIS
jgi:hypothetical protein